MPRTNREVYDDELGRRRCVADSKQAGRRCRNPPIPGGTVCRFHGAAAPQVVRSARERLREAVDPALDALIRPLELVRDRAAFELEAAGTVTEETLARWIELRHQADGILDRTGYPRRTEIDLGDARTRVIDRLRSEAGR